MFGNKFLKHDPLVEAVKTAQQDGAYRRQAEAIVNEQFGVYSRKAVVRENLAAYDAAIEEVYAVLKEGTQIDEISDELRSRHWAKAHKQASKSAYSADQERNKSLDAKTKKGAAGALSRAAKHDAAANKRYRGLALNKRTRTMEEGKGDGNPYPKGKRHDEYEYGKNMKEEKWEGSKEDKAEDAKLAKKHGMTMAQWERSAADKKHDAKEKIDEELKGGQSKIDANKNNKIDAGDFKLLRARKGNMKEGLDVVKKDPSVQRGSSEVSDSNAEPYDRTLPKKFPGAASTVNGPNPTSQRMSNAVKENVTAPKDWAEKRHPNKGAVTKAPVPGVSIAEEEQKKLQIKYALGKHKKPNLPEEVMKESIIAKIRAKHMKEDQSF